LVGELEAELRAKEGWIVEQGGSGGILGQEAFWISKFGIKRIKDIYRRIPLLTIRL
jgi:hypothetical protein